MKFLRLAECIEKDRSQWGPDDFDIVREVITFTKDALRVLQLSPQKKLIEHLEAQQTPGWRCYHLYAEYAFKREDFPGQDAIDYQQMKLALEVIELALRTFLDDKLLPMPTEGLKVLEKLFSDIGRILSYQDQQSALSGCDEWNADSEED